MVREILRLWLAGHGYRSIARLALIDRKSARRYVEAAIAAGLVRERGDEQLTEELLAAVVAATPPGRPPGDRGAAWQVLLTHKAFMTERLDKGLTVVRIQSDLARHKGVEVASRTLYRFCAAECGTAAKRTTVRIDDPDPGSELQVDFGQMGLLHDPEAGRRRVCYALVFTAAYSRHTFVWLTFSQALPAVIEGFEAAWAFFGGVFKVIIPDNLKAVVERPDPLAPRLNEAFVEYAQARGFLIDAARVRHPKDKARVERAVGYVRSSFFAGEDFASLEDARRRAERWCLSTAGLRIHGTTQRRPLEVFRAEEAPTLAPAPEAPYDLPHYAEPKVHRDYHIEVDKALYSVPAAYIGLHVKVRADRHLVRVYHHGVLIKTHPRTRPGGRSTDEADLPPEKAARQIGTEDFEEARQDIEQLPLLMDSQTVALHAVDRLEALVPTLTPTLLAQVRGRLRPEGINVHRASAGAAVILRTLEPIYVTGPSAYFESVVAALEVLAEGGHHLPRIEAVRALRATAAALENELADLDLALERYSAAVLAAAYTAPRMDRGLFVMTAHQAKGKEFDAIVLGDAMDRFWPDDDDHRRLFYVVITRAGKSWTVVAPGQAAAPLLDHLATSHGA
ncbi:MAG: IS21 family transposase [Actinomycetota bacterium]